MKIPKFLRVDRLFNSRKKRLIAAVVVIVAAAATSWFLLNRQALIEDPEPEVFYSKLTGQRVSKEASERPILGVMIENSEEARPQTGLDQAGIVFETTTEGGITRYMALFQDDLPKEVGPVRSLRPAFLDWAMGFDAAFAHVGGSDEALSTADSRKAKSLNEFFNPGPYHRITERAAPHNVYASIADLFDLIRDKGYDSSEVESLPRSDDDTTAEPDAKKIDIFFSYDVFTVQYRYDAETNSYKRYLAGGPHKTPDGEQIKTKNIVVLLNSGGPKGVGSGQALVFKNGRVTKGLWEQKDFSSRIKLYQTTDGQQQDITLNRGITWFASVPASGSVDY